MQLRYLAPCRGINVLVYARPGRGIGATLSGMTVINVNKLSHKSVHTHDLIAATVSYSLYVSADML